MYNLTCFIAYSILCSLRSVCELLSYFASLTQIYFPLRSTELPHTLKVFQMLYDLKLSMEM